MITQNKYLEIAIDSALKAGELIKSRFGGELDIKFKEGVYNLVTEMDTASENLIKKNILTSLPDSIFLAEESGGSNDLKPLTWVIDPIDGTVNYAHGIPIYSVSIALVQEFESIVGVVYNPETNELFYAQKGGGSFLNHKKLSVSKTDKLGKSVLVTGFPYNVSENPYNCVGALNHMLNLGLPIRRLGSAALDLAYTAAGRFDAYWEVELNEWDVAAGALLVREAGGSIISYEKDAAGYGTTNNSSENNFLITKKLLASNGLIEEELKNILNKF